jgi:hypothetical protein
MWGLTWLSDKSKHHSSQDSVVWPLEYIFWTEENSEMQIYGQLIDRYKDIQQSLFNTELLNIHIGKKWSILQIILKK